MRQYLSQRFLSVDTPPHWVEDEPAWPFLNGEPMIFVTQYTLPSTSVAASRLTSGTEVYVFGARVPHPKGYTIEYQVVQQHPGIDGIGDR